MKKLLFLFVLIALVGSCTKDDNISKDDGPFSKAWFMEEYSAGLGGVFDFSASYVLFDFSQSNTTVNVINYPYEPTFILQTGSYSYAVDGSTVTIDGQTFDYIFENDVLVLSDMPEVDGPIIRFVPKENDCVLDPLNDIPWLSEYRNTINVIDCAGFSTIELFTKNGRCMYQVQICAASTTTDLNFYNSDGVLLCDNIESTEIDNCLGTEISSFKKRTLL